MTKKSTAPSKWQIKSYDSIEDLDVETLEMEDLKVLRGSGKSYATGSGENRRVIYRNGMQTRIGDLEKDVWAAVAEQVIERERGAQAIPEMQAFLSSDSCPEILRVPSNLAKQTALEYIVAGDENNIDWDGYSAFLNFKKSKK